MIEDYSKIQVAVQKEIETALEEFSSKLQKDQQYRLSKIQNHVHSGTDAPKIPGSSITSYIAMTGTSNGVVSSSNLAGQSINAQGSILVPPIPGTIYVAQLPIIYGAGVGVASQFNGGFAQEGTMLFFNNGSTVNQLWVMADGTWRGVDFPL